MHRKSNIICLKCSCNIRPNDWARDEVVRSLVTENNILSFKFDVQFDVYFKQLAPSQQEVTVTLKKTDIKKDACLYLILFLYRDYNKISPAAEAILPRYFVPLHRANTSSPIAKEG